MLFDIYRMTPKSLEHGFPLPPDFDKLSKEERSQFVVCFAFEKVSEIPVDRVAADMVIDGDESLWALPEGLLDNRPSDMLITSSFIASYR